MMQGVPGIGPNHFWFLNRDISKLKPQPLYPWLKTLFFKRWNPPCLAARKKLFLPIILKCSYPCIWLGYKLSNSVKSGRIEFLDYTNQAFWKSGPLLFTEFDILYCQRWRISDILGNHFENKINNCSPQMEQHLQSAFLLDISGNKHPTGETLFLCKNF